MGRILHRWWDGRDHRLRKRNTRAHSLSAQHAGNPNRTGITMHVPGRRRRDLLVLRGLGAVLFAPSTGTATAKLPQADPLQQQVDAVHDTGPLVFPLR